MSFKLLQVIPRLDYGGAETGCYDVAHYIAEKGYKSYIITSGGALLKFIRKNKVKVFRLPVHSKNPVLILLNAILIGLIVIFFRIRITKKVVFSISLKLSKKSFRMIFIVNISGIVGQILKFKSLP